MSNRRITLLMITFIVLAAVACRAITGIPEAVQLPAQETPAATTPLPPIAVAPGADNPDEPVHVSGEIPYTSPFFINSLSAPFVLLEDQAGFVDRNLEFTFSLPSQVIGPVEIHPDNTLTYDLSLPSVPQGTFVDVDHDGQQDAGVQVFAVAYWSNTWGDTFLEERDGTGWSTAYASTITDPENDNEIIGGYLIVWAPDDRQSFPTGFGEDGLLFTDDDPTGEIPAGYSMVNLNEEPFEVTKQARLEITLNEGEIAVNDYSEMGYAEAFGALFDKVSREYPFTEEKAIDWQALHDEFTPRMQRANNARDFQRLLHEFASRIPDAHVGVSLDPQVFFEDQGGSFGLVLAETSEGQVIVTQVVDNTPGEAAGIQPGAEILTWNDRPVGEAIAEVVPYFGPYSTPHALRQGQVSFLTRVSPGDRVTVSFRNPDQAEPQQATMQAVPEYESLFLSTASLQADEMALPVEAEILDDSGLGYIRISTFNDDYQLMASLWDRYLQAMIDNEVPGLIIDVRTNGGGSGGLALDFAGYFFDEEIELYDEHYYNERTGAFESQDFPARIKPGPLHYTGPVALLVSPDCVSACEGFAYAMQQDDRAIVVGHYPTAGAFGEVGRGQYRLPDDINMQFPTGRPQSPDGTLIIEGTGVVPDVTVPVTVDSLMGREDAVLQAAVKEVMGQLD